jgi:hypothetical protein
MKANWSVAVVYEDAGMREGAVTFCDHLVARFWTECELDVGWWSFAHLQEPGSAKEAQQKAAKADMIVFATCAEGEIPLEVRAWVEAWLGRRGEREGALVGLLGRGVNQVGEMAGKHVYLRNVAHRGGMDYLTGLPESISHPIPDSLESLSERADRITSVLDEILHHHSPPPQLFT